MTDQPRGTATLDDMRALLATLPALDPASGSAALQAARRAPQPGDPAHPAARRLAASQGRYPPRLDRPRLALFAAAHGVSVHLRRPPGHDLGGRIAAIVERRAPLVGAAEAIDADLRLYELNWQQPTGDITAQPAMTGATVAMAMAYGMMAVDDHIDILCLSALDEGGATAARALGLALFGGRAEDWAPRDEAALIEAAVARHRAAGIDALETLRRLGGEDVAAIAGAILAARFARVPVVLDGLVALAAAGVLSRAAPEAIGHCFTAGDDREPGCRRFADALRLSALRDAGAGDAGVSAVSALRAALGRHLEATKPASRQE